MKKIALLASMLVLTTSSVYAMSITADGTSIGGGVYKPSNGVSVVVFTNGTAGANDGTQYAAGSANVKGKKEYATNNSDPRIYNKVAATAGTPTVAASTWVTDSSWTAQ